LLFRGVIQGLLAERFSAWAAIILATTAFAPLHIIALLGSPTAALLTIIIEYENEDGQPALWAKSPECREVVHPE